MTITRMVIDDECLDQRVPGLAEGTPNHETARSHADHQVEDHLTRGVSTPVRRSPDTFWSIVRRTSLRSHPTMETPFDRLRHRARVLRQLMMSECGQSLVLAMIVMSALTISIGALDLVHHRQRAQFGRDREVARAFHVAEAGVNNGLSMIVTRRQRRAGDGDDTRSVCAFADGAAGSYTMTKHPDDRHGVPTERPPFASCWVITGTATSPNGKITEDDSRRPPTGGSENQQSPRSSNYGLVVDNQGAACVDTHGTVNLTIKDVWISGDFCPSGNVSLIPPAAHTGSVYIGGRLPGEEQHLARHLVACPMRTPTSSAATPSRDRRRSVATRRTAASGRTGRRRSTRRTSRCRSSARRRPTPWATGTRRLFLGLVRLRQRHDRERHLVDGQPHAEQCELQLHGQ